MENILEDPDASSWNFILQQYYRALKAKASKMKPEKKNELIKLDNWYQRELPVLIRERTPQYVTHEEMCKLMKWKLTRGQFRPRLTEMVQTNSQEEVTNASTKAFQLLPDVSAAIQALTVLKAVGPATASAVLAAGAPNHAAFMADESMHALPGLQPIKYDLSFYKEYMRQVARIVKHLNKEDPEKSWSPHTVELTLWTCQIAKTLDPNLYDEIMKEVASCKIKQAEISTTTDGPAKKKLKT